MSWETKSLGELFQVGSSKRVLKSEWKTEGVPFYRGREITRLSIDGFVDNELFISEEHYAEMAGKYGVPGNGDIMITAIGTIGNSYIVGDADRFYFKDASVLWLKRTSDVSSEFVNLWLKSPLFFEQLDTGNGATVDTLTIQKLQSVEIKLPSLSEQQRIVTILDQAFEGIATAAANAEKNLANARELFESELQAVFTSTGDGCLTKSLNEVCLIKPPKSEVKDNLDSSDLVSFIPMESLGINQKYFDASRLKTLKEVAGSYTYFADGDVLLAKITPCFENGKLGVARNLKNGVGFGSSEYIVFRAGPALYNEYLYYFLFRKSFIEDGAARMTGAVGHKRVAKEFIENTLITLPPFAEQKAIVNRLDELFTETKKLEVIYQQKLIALDELKKTLLHRSFAGELTHV